MNHAAFLAVLAAMSFALPFLIRVLLMLNPNVLTLLSIILVFVIVLRTWLRRKAVPNVPVILPEETSVEFSSQLLKPHKPEEDYHASL